MQIPQLPILFLRAADKQQQLPDLSPDKWCLLNHQILAKWKSKIKGLHLCHLSIKVKEENSTGDDKLGLLQRDSRTRSGQTQGVEYVGWCQQSS